MLGTYRKMTAHIPIRPDKMDRHYP